MLNLKRYRHWHILISILGHIQQCSGLSPCTGITPVDAQGSFVERGSNQVGRTQGKCLNYLLSFWLWVFKLFKCGFSSLSQQNVGEPEYSLKNYEQRWPEPQFKGPLKRRGEREERKEREVRERWKNKRGERKERAKRRGVRECSPHFTHVHCRPWMSRQLSRTGRGSKNTQCAE